MTLLITEEDVGQLLTLKDAIEVAEHTFRKAGERKAQNPPRFHLLTKQGYLKIGTGAMLEEQVMGFKVVANSGVSVALNMIFSMETSELLAILQSALVSRLRTSAVAAVAVKYLSPENASTLGLYGSGRLADWHLQAFCAVRPIKKVRVYSRTAKNREAFAERMSKKLGIEVIAVSEPERAARDAEIVLAITNTETPVVFGDWINRPCLVISAGANHWYEREVDEKLVGKSTLVVVDEKGQAKLECGDLIWAVDHGVLSWEQIEEIGDVMTGRVKIPDFSKHTILFESQGIGIHDVSLSLKAYELAKAKGLGTELNITSKGSPKQIVRNLRSAG